MRVAGYARVSPNEAENDTIQNQRELIEKYVAAQGWILVKIFEDDQISGEMPMEFRPAGKGFLKAVGEDLFETAIVWKIDRLGRNTLDSLMVARQVKERGIRILSITEPFDTSGPIGEFIFTLFASAAQLERTNILERTKVGKQKGVRDGRWGGGIAPYGYLLENRQLVIDTPRAEVVRRIFRMFRDGWNASEIADILNAEHIPAPAGGDWRHQTIVRILRNRLYSGEGNYGKLRPLRKDGRREKMLATDPSTWIPFEVPPIIESDEFSEVQNLLSTLRRHGPKSTKHDYMLSGRIVCGICGLPMYGITGGKQGTIPFYRCSSFLPKRQRCGNRYIHGRHLENAVWQDVCKWLSNPDHLLSVLHEKEPDARDYSAEIAAIRKGLTDLETEKQNLLRLARKGLIDDVELSQQRVEVDEQDHSLQRRLDSLIRLRDSEEGIRLAWHQTESLIRQVASYIETCDTRQRFMVIRRMVKQVSVKKEAGEVDVAIEFQFDGGCTMGTYAVACEANIHPVPNLTTNLRFRPGYRKILLTHP